MPRRPAGALLALVALGLACGRAPEAPRRTADPSSLRTLAQGAVVGFADDEGGHAWLGIPFAEPPVGELRWRAPRPPAAWEGTREALERGDICMQFAGPLAREPEVREGEPTGSEDCLTLDVYAPRREPGSVAADDAGLPVMVWIHGGGNTIGSARSYDGGHLAATRDVVVVVVQYRLGVFGWLSHPALRPADASADDASGNYGTLDLIRALEWVRENAAAFGGDPGRVTIFGESAGARNVYSLLLSPRAEGLFHRAIAQSGGTDTVTRTEAENLRDAAEPGHPRSSRELFLDLLVRQGRASGRGSALLALGEMSEPEIAAWLRSRDAGTILRLFSGERLGGMYDAPRLVRDGAVLPDLEPLEAFRRGAYNRVPAVLGTNRDETKLFLAFGSPHVRRAFRLPVSIRDSRRYDLEAEYGSLMWKARGVDEPAEAMRAAQGPSVFGYRFDWDDERRLLWLDLGRLLGAAHGLEIPFVFGRLQFVGGDYLFDPSRRELDLALSRAITSYWTAFAATGEPGRGRDGALPEWAPWAAGTGPKFLVLDSEDDRGIRMSSDTVTRDQVIERLATDERFRSPAERCEIYASFTRRSEVLTPEEYAQVAGRLCAAHPLGESAAKKASSGSAG